MIMLRIVISMPSEYKCKLNIRWRVAHAQIKQSHINFVPDTNDLDDDESNHKDDNDANCLLELDGVESAFFLMLLD
jgi:hypothetical protein